VQLVRDEEKIKINIPLFLLPSGSKEEDILNVTIAKGVKETEAAKERLTNLLEKLKNKNKT
jgi:hypothetical protein